MRLTDFWFMLMMLIY